MQFKLEAAKIHLDSLKQLERDWPGQNFAVTNPDNAKKMRREMELDEILYYLVGVKEALLQEINSKFSLGLAQRDVNEESVNIHLKAKKGRSVAKDIMRDIFPMTSCKSDPLWLINDLHNQSEHRDVLKRQLTTVDSRISKPALIDTSTPDEDAIRRDDGSDEQIPVVEYLEQSYRLIDDLQKTVRSKIQKYPV